MKTLASRHFRFFTATCLAVALLGAMPIAGRDSPAMAAEDAARPMASIVVDVETGKVLSQDRASERRYPASTTKLMTAYLALKALRDERAALDTPVVMTRRAAAEPPSKMGFQPGSVMRLDSALRMMLVKSANDVAYAIGQTIGGGSMDDFVAMMNDTARRLGMLDTRFINANGLPGDGQYSSAKDLAILGVAIRREFPAFSDFFNTEAISNGKRVMNNGNKLLGRFDGADGMKTGYICASGFNLVSSATREGRTLVAVVIGANGTIERERNSAEILEAGFKADLAKIDTTVDELPTATGEPLDVSGYICSSEGRTARANERVEEKEREETYGSPYLHEMDRSPVVLQVGLGGAAGNDIAEPGISLISAYGIPLPTPRPERPQETAMTPPLTVDDLIPPAIPAEADATDVRGEDVDYGGEGDAARKAVAESAAMVGNARLGDPAASDLRSSKAETDGLSGKTSRLDIYREGGEAPREDGNGALALQPTSPVPFPTPPPPAAN
ncbi:MAG TPA: D-alanyl-D-alanine carboxypeptidase family protein [Aurantimonas sp.]